MKAKSLDKKFDDNQSDIVDELDLSTIKRPNQTQKRVNVDFPTWMIESGSFQPSCPKYCV